MRTTTWITVPTYWGDNGTAENPADTGSFDHPTPLEGPQTLERTINSLCELPQEFSILVILAVTHRELRSNAKKIVRDLLLPYAQRQAIYLVTSDEVEHLQREFDLPVLSLFSYGSIRNVQLIIPYLADCEYVVAIDDDEIIEDRHYLKKINDHMISVPLMKGLSGPYLNEAGGYLLDTTADSVAQHNPFLKKGHLINLAVTKAMNEPLQPHRSHIAFGGNMIFTRDLIAKICHDEFICRGEDFDYVLNAISRDIDWYFCSDIPIVHLPPKKLGKTHKDQIDRLLADFSRFLYSCEKIEPLGSLDLEPYPGPFLKDTETLKEYCIDTLLNSTQDKMARTEAVRIIDEIHRKAIGMKTSYERYRRTWEEKLQDTTLKVTTEAKMTQWLKTIRL